MYYTLYIHIISIMHLISHYAHYALYLTYAHYFILYLFRSYYFYYSNIALIYTYLDYTHYFFVIRNVKKSRKSSAPAEDTASDSENDGSGDPTGADKISSERASRKINTKGLELLSNGVVSMRALILNTQVPTKGRDADTPSLFNASLNVSKATTLLTFIHSGKHLLVEKHRDEAARMIVFRSAAPYCLNEESAAVILDADPEEHSAYLIGAAKISQHLFVTACTAR